MMGGGRPDGGRVSSGGGSVEEFNGLLVVRASQDVHREIKNLLEMMREAAKKNNGREKAVPDAAVYRSGTGGEGENAFGHAIKNE
jgi:hypothetical protein